MNATHIGRGPLHVVAAAALAAVFALPAAQAGQRAAKAGVTEGATCIAGFSTPGSFQFATCVTDTGNIMQFDVQGRTHIYSEGYAVCMPDGANYWDTGLYGESGWGSPLIAQPNGPNTLPLTITRVSLDGRLHLAQTYEVDLRRNRITVMMHLTNVSGVTIPSLALSRDVEIDIGDYTNDNFVATSLGIIAYDVDGGALALTANTAGPEIESSVDYGFNVMQGDCAPAGNSYGGDGGGKVTYKLGELKPLRSHTVKYMYTAD